MFSLPTLSYTNYSLQIQKLSFTIIHSTTIALPAWRKVCRELDLKERLIPCNVVTRWNSTYDMMKFVLAYKNVIDRITADKSLKLRKYELDNEDWGIIKDLVAILEVRVLIRFGLHLATDSSLRIDIQKSNSFLLSRFSEHCRCDTCNGQARLPSQPSYQEPIPSSHQGHYKARMQEDQPLLFNDWSFFLIPNCNG